MQKAASKAEQSNSTHLYFPNRNTESIQPYGLQKQSCKGQYKGEKKRQTEEKVGGHYYTMDEPE
jgi:hypothetical protein